MISFYADENVDRRITNGLRRRGVDVLTAQEANLVGRIPDEQQLQFATDHGRALLTADTDLLGIARDWGTAGHPYAGVVFYHSGWTSIGHVVNEVHAIAHDARPEVVGGRVLFHLMEPEVTMTSPAPSSRRQLRWRRPLPGRPPASVSSGPARTSA